MHPTAHTLLFTTTFLLSSVLSSAFSPTRPETLSMLDGNYSSLWPKFSNTTVSPGNINSLRTECSGQHFGLNPVISDCQCARDHISPDFVQHMWGIRHTGLPDTYFPLPYRIMGSESPAHNHAQFVETIDELFSFPRSRPLLLPSRAHRRRHENRTRQSESNTPSRR